MTCQLRTKKRPPADAMGVFVFTCQGGPALHVDYDITIGYEYGQGDCKGAAYIGLAFGPNLPAMLFGNGFDDGQAEAAAGDVIQFGSGPIKFLKYAGQISGLNARTVIDNGYQGMAIVLTQLDPNLAPFGCIFDGIVK